MSTQQQKQCHWAAAAEDVATTMPGTDMAASTSLQKEWQMHQNSTGSRLMLVLQ
jgi:hypothetical protein